MAWEALHNIGHHKPDMVIILNDNGMSIAPSVGAIENYLRRHRQLPADWFRKLRSEPHYLQLKRMVEEALAKMGTAGEVTLEIIRHIKNNIKEWLIPPGMLFEELGFTYLGPVDGHNTEVLIECLHEALRLEDLSSFMPLRRRAKESRMRKQTHGNITHPKHLLIPKLAKS